MSLISTIIFRQSKVELQQRIVEKLDIINNLKIERIKSHFDNVNKSISQIEYNSELEDNFNSVVDLYSNDDNQRLKAQEAQKKLHNIFQTLEKTYSFNRLTLKSLDGITLVESHTNRNLEHNDSLLYKTNSHIFIDAQKGTEYSDIYHPQGREDEFYLTVLTPYFKNDFEKEPIAIICCEIPMKPIYQAVEDTTGLGNSGESILIKRNFNKMHFISRPRNFIGDFLKREYDIKKNVTDITVAQYSVSHKSSKNDFGLEVLDYDGTTLVDGAWNFINGVNWGIVTKIDHKESFTSINYLKAIIILLCSGILFFSVIIITIFVERFLTPIIQIRDNLVSLAKGEFPKRLEYEMSDEIKDTSTALNNLVDRLKNSTDFAQQIGTGNLNAQYYGQQSQDVLSSSLLQMQESLIRIQEENNRRKWATEGITIHGELFRKNHKDIKVLGDDFIRSLINYIKGVNGAVYIINHVGASNGLISLDDDSTYFELIGTYAYDIKDDTPKKFRVGQGLVGQCAKERKTLSVNDTSGSNHFIVSGLGKSIPSYIYCIPMILNNQVLGVVEITNFKGFPAYVIQFIETLGESFASSIMNVKSSLQTSNSLKEFESTTFQLLQEQEEVTSRYERALTEIKALKRKINMLEKSHEDLG